MSSLDMEVIIFEIISHGGTGKGLAYEALRAAEKGDYEEADRLMKEADKELLAAHNIQTQIIQQEAEGKNAEVTVLFVHAQDHLMTAIEAKSLIECMIRLYKRLDDKN